MKRKILLLTLISVLCLSLCFAFGCDESENHSSSGNNSEIVDNSTDDLTDSSDKEPEEKLYTITFETNGGKPLENIVKSVSKILILPNAEKDGYDFLGWYFDSDLKNECKLTVMPSEDFTLYAKWSVITYTITYNMNCGINSDENPKEYTVENEDKIFKNPTKNGYDFAGWYSDSEFINEIDKIDKGSFGDIELYAKWELIIYSITYHLDGGINSDENPLEYNIESENIFLKSPVKAEYKFIGWYSDSEFTNEIDKIDKGSLGNIKLYAKWKSYLTYVAQDDGYVVTGLSERAITKVEITSSYNNKPVTSIGNGAFSGCSGLTSVKIPDTVTSIGNSAFSGCSGLTSVRIPDTVTSIGDRAFSGCSSLTSVKISDNVTSIGEGSFFLCSSLTSVKFSDSVTSIGDRAFSGCSSLTSIEIPDGVTSIGDRAFLDCRELISVKLPGRLTAIGSCVFMNCWSLRNIVIPDSVNTIGDSAFKRCESINNLYIPGTVKEIGNNAFEWCDALVNLVIADGVEIIGGCAFKNCASIFNVVIPKSVVKIGKEVFSIPFSAELLQRFYYKGTIEELKGVWTDSDCSMLEDDFLYYSEEMPADTTLNYWHYDKYFNKPVSWKNICDENGLIYERNNDGYIVCGYNGNGGILIIPDNVNGVTVTAIDFHSLRFYTEITGIVIPAGITRIDCGAFMGCEGLENIKVNINNPKYYSEGNCLIEKATNKLCLGCKNSKIPDNVTSIGDYAFAGCRGLKFINLPEGLISIGRCAFMDCSSLTSVKIPDSITTIYAFVFYNCKELESVYYKGTSSDWDKINNQDEWLTSATRYYYSATKPTDTTLNYWHYDKDGKTPVIW